MPMPMVMPTVTASPKTTPSTRSRRPRPSGGTASAATDSSTVTMRGVLLKKRRSDFPEYLPEVTLEVFDVVAHEVFERGRLVGRDGGEAYLVQVVLAPLAQPLVLGRVATDVPEMEIVEAPEVNEQRPRLVCVSLRAHPLLLRVAVEDEVFLELRADEALVVVRGGVDEVTHYLLRRPLPFGGTRRGQRLGDGEQARRSLLDRPREIFEHIFQCRHLRVRLRVAGRFSSSSSSPVVARTNLPRTTTLTPTVH